MDKLKLVILFILFFNRIVSQTDTLLISDFIEVYPLPNYSKVFSNGDHLHYSDSTGILQMNDSVDNIKWNINFTDLDLKILKIFTFDCKSKIRLKSCDIIIGVSFDEIYGVNSKSGRLKKLRTTKTIKLLEKGWSC